MSLNTLCGLFGKSRQGFYKQISFTQKTQLENEIVLSVVQRIRVRSKTKRWGVRKLQGLVNLELKGMGRPIGRDRLFHLLRNNNMLVRSRKRRFFTTQSHHWLHKYDNLIEDKKLTGPNQLWVADITYIKSNGTVYYLYLITDAYSQKIVGWHVSLDLKAKSATSALSMAIQGNENTLDELIHHSDRGVQYCSAEYVRKLQKHHIAISMTKPASPQDNAIAERINGILKEEWLYDLKENALPGVREKIKSIIGIYNTYRPHNTLKNRTPHEVHDLGFKRHKPERVIGKLYHHKKKPPKLTASQ